MGGRLTALEHEGIAAGIELGGRLQTPTRVAPFIGVVGFAGWTPDSLAFGNADVSVPGQDNNSGLLSIGPEAGVHFWMTPQWRATAFAAHHFASMPDGNRSADYTTLGLSFTRFHVPAYRSKRECGDSIETQLARASMPRSSAESETTDHPGTGDSPYSGLIPQSVGASNPLPNPAPRVAVRPP